MINRLKKEEGGQAVVETALVLPIILVLVMVGITISMFIYAHIIVTMSATNGARVGAAVWKDSELSNTEKNEKIKNAALGLVGEALVDNERRYKIEEDDGMLSVTVEYDMKVVLPFSNLLFDENTVTVAHTAYYYIGK